MLGQFLFNLLATLVGKDLRGIGGFKRYSLVSLKPVCATPRVDLIKLFWSKFTNTLL